MTSAVPAPLTITGVSEYGRDKMHAVAGIADRITSVARSGDIDEVGKAMNKLLAAAREYDPTSSGRFGFVKKWLGRAVAIKDKYATVDSNVTYLVTEVEKQMEFFKKRIGDLEVLYEDNEKYHESLRGLADDFDEKIRWMEENPPAVDDEEPTAFSVQKKMEWQTTIDYGKKRADDIRRAMVLAEQQAPQIKLMATNSAALVQKFSEIKTTTIPVLKSTYALYVLNREQTKGAKFADGIDELTNSAMKKNAALLGENTEVVHQSLARSAIEVETLMNNQQALISSIEEVHHIHADMVSRINRERPAIERMSRDLAKRIEQAS